MLGSTAVEGCGTLITIGVGARVTVGVPLRKGGMIFKVGAYARVGSRVVAVVAAGRVVLIGVTVVSGTAAKLHPHSSRRTQPINSIVNLPDLILASLS